MARRLEEGFGSVTVEAHACTQAITMDLRAGDGHRAQHLVHEWHAQGAVHALRHPPLVLIIGFARYCEGPAGPAKNHATLHPLFAGDSLESRNCRYTVEAAIRHSGPTIRSGLWTLHHSAV